MEYIDGINLRQFAKACGGVIESYILFNMLKEVIAALCAVHEAGIVHRDISPDNIMIDKEYHAKVIDFGAAKHNEIIGNRIKSAPLFILLFFIYMKKINLEK